jgi:tetratricopeptide (TPR) repeat protein
MIVRDEAARLATCLNSVRSLVDEMVIVDTGSQDDTIAIAQGFGARIITFTWCNDFAAARNLSLEQAQGDWILVLDADETVVQSVMPTLRQVTQQPDVLLVNLVRHEIGAAQAPYSLVSRLFRNRPDLRFARPYHELVDDSVSAIVQQEPHWRILSLPDVALLHEGYQAADITGRNKTERARRIMEAALETYPTDAYLCSKLGALYVQSGEVMRGLTLLEYGLAVNPAEAAVRYELSYHLGIAYSQVQDNVTAIAHYRSALEQPILPQLKLAAYNNLGNLLQAQGDLAGAKLAYQTMVEIAPGFAIAHFNLAVTLKALGDLSGALTHYQQAIALDPDYISAHRNLGVLLLKLGRVDESKAAFQRAIVLYQQQRSPEAEQLRQALADIGLYVD